MDKGSLLVEAYKSTHDVACLKQLPDSGWDEIAKWSATHLINLFLTPEVIPEKYFKKLWVKCIWSSYLRIHRDCLKTFTWDWILTKLTPKQIRGTLWTLETLGLWPEGQPDVDSFNKKMFPKIIKKKKGHEHIQEVQQYLGLTNFDYHLGVAVNVYMELHERTKLTCPEHRYYKKVLKEQEDTRGGGYYFYTTRGDVHGMKPALEIIKKDKFVYSPEVKQHLIDVGFEKEVNEITGEVTK